MPTNGKFTAVEAAFKLFEQERVRLPKAEYEAAQEVHPQVREAAEAGLPAGTTSLLGGSYGRKVQAGPNINDIDVIIELDHDGDALSRPASETLEKVREAVKESALVRLTRVSVRAVKAFLHDYEFTVDIVPGIRPVGGEGLYLARHLPDEGFDDWQLLNPRGQQEAATQMHNDTSGLYRPVVRIIRFWNASYSPDKKRRPLRSYHAEALVYHSIAEAESYVDAVVRFFDHAYDMLGPGMYTPDPGDPSEWVDERLTPDERATSREKVEEARQLAHEAAGIDDPEEAMEAWAKLFGAAFPAPSTSRDTVAKAMKAGSGGIAGSGYVAKKDARPTIPARSWRRRS